MIDSIILKNTKTGQRLNINKHQGEYWLDEVDLGVVDSSGNTFKFIDQVGETLVSTSLLTRSISISGWVASENEQLVKNQKVMLNRFVNPRIPIELWIGEYKLTFSPKTSIKYAVGSENNEVICKFLITGTAYDPMFTTNEKQVQVAYIDKRFRFPLILPKDTGILMGVRQPSLIALVINDGALPTGYKIEFTASAGSVVNPKLFDIGSQQYIKINKTLVSGESVIINTREGERKITGVLSSVELNYFKYRDLSSSWLELALDENLLRYSADSGEESLSVSIYYSPRFLEVDD